MRAIRGVDDSKKLTATEREKLATRIRERALSVSIGAASVREIDRINIYQAAVLAMRRALGRLRVTPDHVLVDGDRLPNLHGLGKVLTARAIIDGDVSEPAISAASILAKTARDSYMDQMDTVYPAYCFASHKGYATRNHQRLLTLHGPCPLHRRSFEPVRLAVLCEA